MQRIAAHVDAVAGGGTSGQSLQFLGVPQFPPEKQATGGHVRLPNRLRFARYQDALQVGGCGGGGGFHDIALRLGRRI